jgi:coniferyl-aldehyde dehydrogenase
MLDKPTTTLPHSDLGKAGLMEILDRQRAAHLAAGPLSAAARIEWLDRLIGLVVDNHDEIAQVLNEDFGGRSREATLLADVVSVLGSLKHAKANLEDWMTR